MDGTVRAPVSIREAPSLTLASLVPATSKLAAPKGLNFKVSRKMEPEGLKFGSLRTLKQMFSSKD